MPAASSVHTHPAAAPGQRAPKSGKAAKTAGSPGSPVAFDAYDTRLLAELQADARLTMAELGRRVHLSQPAVTERVRRLEGAGVITGYRATVDLRALGYGIRALMRVGRAEFARVVKAVQSSPEVLSAYNVTGDDSWVIEIAVIDVAHLDAVVSKFCLLTETSTAIVLNVVREHTPVRPARPEDVRAPVRKGLVA